MVAEKLRDISTEWQRSSTVKTGIRATLHPSYAILQEKEKKSKQLTLHSFLLSFEPSSWPSSAK